MPHRRVPGCEPSLTASPRSEYLTKKDSPKSSPSTTACWNTPEDWSRCDAAFMNTRRAQMKHTHSIFNRLTIIAVLVLGASMYSPAQTAKPDVNASQWKAVEG